MGPRWGPFFFFATAGFAIEPTAFTMKGTRVRFAVGDDLGLGVLQAIFTNDCVSQVTLGIGADQRDIGADAKQPEHKVNAKVGPGWEAATLLSWQRVGAGCQIEEPGANEVVHKRVKTSSQASGRVDAVDVRHDRTLAQNAGSRSRGNRHAKAKPQTSRELCCIEPAEGRHPVIDR